MYRKLAYTKALRNYSRIASRWQLISPDGIFYSQRVSEFPQLQSLPLVKAVPCSSFLAKHPRQADLDLLFLQVCLAITRICVRVIHIV